MNGEPQPPDDSGGFCCVMAGMHMGHDEDCPGYACPECGREYSEDVGEPCLFCGGGGLDNGTG